MKSVNFMESVLLTGEILEWYQMEWYNLYLFTVRFGFTSRLYEPV